MNPVRAVFLACALVPFISSAQTPSPDPYLANNRPPDDRFKADILVVVAHPDDEGMAAAYIARAIDKGKRVAIVWTTRGDGGQNVVGPEQGPAMGDIREVEGMQAAASLGVKLMWNLGGPDTPTQNPLNSLATCDHARCLERIVRIVRLTRPAVILTWLPAPVTGENHGDHQAAAIMATEAFDMAGDPTAFPEQATPASEPGQNANHLAGLRPWQPQKLYYFSNATHSDFLDNRGPSYDATDISPTRHISYGEIAAREFAFQETQGGREVKNALDRRGDEALKGPLPFSKPTEFLLGKSLVSAAVTDDVLAGTDPAGIPFQPSPGYHSMPVTRPALLVGGVWNYYREFWRAHQLGIFAGLLPIELTVAAGDHFSLPLIVDNPTASPVDVTFAVDSPGGFTTEPIALLTVPPHSRAFTRMRAQAPPTRLSGWQQFKVTAQSNGASIGSISLRVEMGAWALPQ
ncbi:MAG TPA: PIG-L family deacetylase [Terracidiphilus sp.]|nr:PIG-L family deacetylase [Terracidiphilus sp.]